MEKLPYLSGVGKNTVLYVDDRPFFLRSGEVHNSSASDLSYMEDKVWPVLRGRHMNSLIVPVYWECMEPEEGVFDDALVDGLLQQARQAGLRLVLVWFGLWKNSSSTYVPTWVKKDRKRFWYVRDEKGEIPTYFGDPNFIISPFCQEAVEADRRAFAHLMRHLRAVDEQRTVILIQVENEVGVLGARRDFSPLARKKFLEDVPQTLGGTGTWQKVFGEDADEAFMAWHYARAVERIASAGKEVYPLPMCVNAWLEQEPWIPGTYPSGGPQFKNHSIWQKAAPSIDLYAPDIYVPYYKAVCREYAGEGNPLFIPETRGEAAFYLYAVGEHNAICFSPFGIEDVLGGDSEADAMTLALLRIDPDVLATMRRNGMQLFQAYALVERMEGQILNAHRQGKIAGFLYGGEPEETVFLSQVALDVHYEHTEPGNPAGGGLVLELEPNEFLVLAINCTLRFRRRDGGLLDTLEKEEGRFVDGGWVRGRILNGDERYHNVVGSQVTLLRFRLLSIPDEPMQE